MARSTRADAYAGSTIEIVVLGVVARRVDRLDAGPLLLELNLEPVAGRRLSVSEPRTSSDGRPARSSGFVGAAAIAGASGLESFLVWPASALRPLVRHRLGLGFGQLGFGGSPLSLTLVRRRRAGFLGRSGSSPSSVQR